MPNKIKTECECGRAFAEFGRVAVAGGSCCGYCARLQRAGFTGGPVGALNITSGVRLETVDAANQQVCPTNYE